MKSIPLSLYASRNTINLQSILILSVYSIFFFFFFFGNLTNSDLFVFLSNRYGSRIAGRNGVSVNEMQWMLLLLPQPILKMALAPNSCNHLPIPMHYIHHIHRTIIGLPKYHHHWAPRHFRGRWIHWARLWPQITIKIPLIVLIHRRRRWPLAWIPVVCWQQLVWAHH